MSNNIVYIAMGYDYLIMAINSAMSVRRTGTKASIKLISNFKLKAVVLDGATVFDTVEHIGVSDDENRWVKTNIISQSETSRNLFLDCDTEVLACLDPMFRLLDHYDVLARNLPFETKAQFDVFRDLQVKDLALSEINTGVLFFSNSEGAKEMLASWHRNFLEMGESRDQPAFLRALLLSRTSRFLALPPLWNATPFRKVDLQQMLTAPDKIKILHYRDPVYWPSIAPKLADVHNRAQISLEDTDPVFSNAAASYGALARIYKSPFFQLNAGRVLLSWLLPFISPGRNRLKKNDRRKVPGLPR